MRRALFLALAALTGGCAVGSTPGDLGGELPAITLSPPPSTLASGTGSTPSDRDRAKVTGSGFVVNRPLETVCRVNAFCDDFEDGAPGARWTATLISGVGSAVDFVGPSSGFGAHALHATTSGSGGSAYLSLARGHLGTQWAGALAVSLRIDALPSTVVGGPELAVVDTNGAMTRIGFSVRPEGIALHQFFEACAGSTCVSRSDIIADVKPGEWHRLVLGIETGVGLGAGRIEVTVDASELIVLPLSVMPVEGNAEVHAGITVADGQAAALHVDDVVFFTH